MKLPGISIRYQRVSDARRFLEILSNPNFTYFPAKPKSVEEEVAFLRQNSAKRKEGSEYNYAVVADGKVVGAVGVKVNRHYPFIGELGYFVDEPFWGRGIACLAVRLLERVCFGELGLTRLEILMVPRNAASRRVAQKSGYRREGLLKNRIVIGGKHLDALLYAKTRP
jgi:[ribosomal protein S5]-alanine N-acetyltransferase